MRPVSSALLSLPLLCALLLAPAPAAACKKGGQCDKASCPLHRKAHDETAKKDAARGVEDSFGTITVEEVSALIAQVDAKVVILDVNREELRAEVGIIPGAKLLSSSTEYDVAKELPAAKDTKLVFYCANIRCTASHRAARRAATAGYADVHVLPDGILGWKSAGKATTPVPGI
jgi:rhodanese-related sulfurtransferase